MGLLEAVPKCRGRELALLLALLAASAQPQNQVQSRLFLDVVVGERAPIFELLSGEDQALLVWWDPLFVLNLGFDIIDCVGGFHLEGDRLAREGFNEDLHVGCLQLVCDG